MNTHTGRQGVGRVSERFECECFVIVTLSVSADLAGLCV